MQKLVISSVRDSIRSKLWESDIAELLEHLLSRGAKIAVFAGAVRDTVFAEEHGFTDIKPRDWDIGISHISRRDFDGILNEAGGWKNKYGGFKLAFNRTLPCEIWRQEDTVGLRKTRSPFNLENILRSFVLSCNAIALDLDKGHIYDHG
jgi:hypothetical protein